MKKKKQNIKEMLLLLYVDHMLRYGSIAYELKYMLRYGRIAYEYMEKEEKTKPEGWFLETESAQNRALTPLYLAEFQTLEIPKFVTFCEFLEILWTFNGGVMGVQGFHKNQFRGDNLFTIIERSDYDGILDLTHFVNSLKSIKLSMAGAMVFQGLHKNRSHDDNYYKS